MGEEGREGRERESACVVRRKSADWRGGDPVWGGV